MNDWKSSKVFEKYTKPLATKRDVSNALEEYDDLRVNIKKYYFSNGIEKKLLCLSGTIPVMIAKVTYHIPIEIWIQETYPHTPPICFVTPTKTMQLRPVKNMLTDGRLDLPYLNEWRAQTHNVLGCIQVILVEFTEEPPVVAKETLSSNLPKLESRRDFSTAVDASGSNSHFSEDDLMHKSMVSAANDALKRCYNSKLNEVKALKQANDKLKSGKNILNSKIQKAESIVAEIDKNIAWMKSTNQEMEKEQCCLKTLSEEFDIDQVIQPTTPLYSQIVNLVAEEQALEDTAYYLFKALEKSAVDWGIFIKEMRSLTRHQFVLRALIQKARNVAGLFDDN